MRIIILLTISILLICCKNKTEENVSTKLQTVETPKNEVTKNAELKVFTKEDLAKFTISAIMGNKPKIMKSEKRDDFYYVSYIRPSDSKKFEYKVKFDGNKIYWATIDGRWREDALDEQMSFSEEENIIKITQKFSDGSSSSDEFKRSDL